MMQTNKKKKQQARTRKYGREGMQEMGRESIRVTCTVCFLLCRGVLCGEMKLQAPEEWMKEWRENDRVTRRGRLNGTARGTFQLRVHFSTSRQRGLN